MEQSNIKLQTIRRGKSSKMARKQALVRVIELLNSNEENAVLCNKLNEMLVNYRLQNGPRKI